MKQFLIQQVITILFATTNKIQYEGDKCLQELTTRQFMLLLAVAHIPVGKCTLNELARRTGTTKQNVKQIVTVLEKNNVVVIENNPLDKRAKNIIVTEYGKELFRRMAKAGNQFLDTIGKQFNEEELQILWKLLKKIYSHNGEEFIDYHADEDKS